MAYGASKIMAAARSSGGGAHGANHKTWQRARMPKWRRRMATSARACALSIARQRIMTASAKRRKIGNGE